MDLSQIFISRPDLLDDEKKLKSAFSDFYANDIGRINRMMKAYEVGVLEALVSGKDSDLEKKKLIDRLVTLHDMQETKAAEAINEWVKICNKKVIAEYKKFLSEKKQKETEQKEEKAKKEQAQNQEKKKKEQEQKLAEEQAGELSIDYDNYDRYINLDLSQGSLVRGIPCGVGNGDFGFIVKGTGHEDLNNHDPFPSVHALVYNFLIRDSHITKEAYPQYMKNHPFNHELNYGHVYRYIMILLDLLKPEGETVLKLNILGDKDEVTAAQEILNEYLAVFGRLTRSAICSVRVVEDSKGKSISAESKADYYVENYTSDQGLRRRIRYGSRINYRLDKTNKADLEFILREISPFASFKKGQFDALCSMMNSNGHARV